MKTDIEIAKSANMENICEISNKLNIKDEYLEQYGKYKAKISNNIMKEINKNEDGKIILVTSINPTPLGEGKTTISIGLADALNKIGKKSILALREPSLGPVFGIKGGAAGGGYSQVVPMEDINLHFTGDIHAITTANNLISAVIDNHIFQGNELKFEKVIWKRCMDLNDRQLRKIETGLSGEKNLKPREDGFDITVASEIMAILCLSNDIRDLEKKVANIVVGYNDKNEEIKVRDLKIEGSIAVLLKDAIKPNLVQTLENNPALIHGGPFANIAHGCNSIIATKMAMKMGEYVVTEAGFGADLGAEKFLDIKCRKANIFPSIAVCVATIKALKYHGGVEKDKVTLENLEALKKGIKNLLKHVNNLQEVYGLNVIVAINRFSHDTDREIELLSNELKKIGIQVSLVESFSKGGIGAEDLAHKIVELSNKNQTQKFAYELDIPIKDKILKIAQKVYGADSVEYEESANKQIADLEKRGYGNLPVCIAKTQYSLSDDPKNLECNTPFNIHVKEVKLRSGAGFIVVLTGKVMTMPGLPKIPNAEKIKLDEEGQIIGLF